ncbi:FKBP-type peptidyl-prolyl cis-trans isomerase [Parasediminibacterium sp. JCM 36343]|uniref:FKBP-type peptidyl-prolyl cis-trans isomerase n=1 Tax=Parasediminibacterium sp. JCM 36343 TaxID=3374279 RepID=UPI00397A97C9
MKQVTTVLAIALLMASCNQFDKSKSGMPYKITKGGNSTLLKNGQFVKFNLEFKLGAKDSILNSSFGHLPNYMKYDSAQLGKYNFTEVLPKCAVGDKMEFTLSIDSLKSMGMIPEYNKVFTKGDVIKGKMEIISVFSDEKLIEADYKKEVEQEKQKEIKELETYMSSKGIKAQKTPGGAFVEISTPGDMTLKADSGKQATVLYKGYTTDGKVFDSNMDKPGMPPFNVVVGAKSVIPGWDEGLRFFGKGTKGRILVPAMLAYGQQGAGAAIKPFTNLVFDVQVVDVTTPPPPPPAKPNPMEMPQQAPPAKK